MFPDDCGIRKTPLAHDLRQSADNGGMSELLPRPNAPQWCHRLLELGPGFFAPQTSLPVSEPVLLARNDRLIEDLGWTDWCHATDAAHWSGNTPLAGSQSLATVYSGHQFGVWAGQLGDGRALWLGEAQSRQGPQEIQLKGAGPTPFSRGGDGRAVLRSSIREYLCSEAMHGLGIASTRALCLVGSTTPVMRERLETAAVVTRIAPSFLRFGHFEHFAARQDFARLRSLADHVRTHHLPPSPELLDQWRGQADAALLHQIVERTARLLAQWQAVGFCHGVMNTDNMSLLGLTLDYGPFQFLDQYDPEHVCNHSDSMGRYAFHRQPGVAAWNLERLGQAMLPLIGDADMVMAVLDHYAQAFYAELHRQWRLKMGFDLARSTPAEEAAQIEQVGEWLSLLADEGLDHTQAWRQLSQAMADSGTQPDTEAAHWQALGQCFTDVRRQQAWQGWLARFPWQSQHTPEAMGRAMLRRNPKYVLRNHLAETAIRAAEAGDPGEIRVLEKLLQSPFDEHPEFDSRAALPPAWATHLQISCSS